MTNATIYEIHDGDKHRCTDCGRWTYGGAVRHAKNCDFADDATFHAEIDDSQAAPVSAAPAPGTVAKLYRHAKAGDLALVATDDEILDAVLWGSVSVSDAMNQDF